MQNEGISKHTLRRLPLYLEYLNGLPEEEERTISANAIASALEMGEVKVRKDLACVSTAGRPKVGYLLKALKHDLQAYLTSADLQCAVLVGAGALGRAMIVEESLKAYGLHILAVFDEDAQRLERIGDIPVLEMNALADYCRENRVRIGILTVPQERAQEALEALGAGGVRAVWSFVPKHLRAPQGVLVQQENFAGTLSILTQHLKNA